MLILGDDIVSPIVVVTNDTFKAYFNDTLTSFSIPSGVTTIAQSMFENKTSLKTITIPETVKTINSYAFRNSGLTKIVIPDSVTTLNSETFRGCASLVDISIGTGITQLPTGTFRNTGAVTINIPKNITSIGNYVFSSSYIKYITIPNSVTTLNAYVFFSSKNLESVVFEENSPITKINTWTFGNCEKLKEIKIPSGVTSIDSAAFIRCYELLKYDFTECTQVPTLQSTNVFSGINANCKIYVPDDLYDTWIGATNWSSVASHIAKASEMPAE